MYKDNPTFSFKHRRFVANNNQLVHPAVRKRTGMWKLLKDGIVSAKDFRIALAYVNAFAARVSTGAFTAFIPLWFNAYFRINNLCDVKLDDKGEATKLCDGAINLSSLVLGISFTTSFFAAFAFGAFSDLFTRTSSAQKQRRWSLVGFPSFVGALFSAVCEFIIFVWDDPRDPWLLAVVGVLGVFDVGTSVLGAALASGEYVKPDVRGSVGGMFGFFGGLGKLRHWRFCICLHPGGTSSLTLILTFALRQACS